MKRILFIPVLFFLMVACGPIVTFNQPQPVGVDSLTVMPKKLMGDYLSKDGAARLTINQISMVIKCDYVLKQFKDSIGWDTLSVSVKRQYKVVGDSVVKHITETDTLFCFSEDNVLKKYKGYYFLNRRQEKNSWYVQKLTFQKGQLSLASISTKVELQTLDTINESPADTSIYNFSFTRKQFYEYLDKDGFLNVDTFLKVK